MKSKRTTKHSRNYILVAIRANADITLEKEVSATVDRLTRMLLPSSFYKYNYHHLSTWNFDSWVPYHPLVRH